MKTRNRTQAAFPQPDSSWSRKTSLMIVIRIQIQITKKKTSKATRRASPMLMSANGKVNPFGGGGHRQPTSADDDLAVHEGVVLAVVAERPLLREANRDAVAGLDVTGVECARLGRGVGRARGVGENDPRALGDIERVRVEFEVTDADRPCSAGAGAGSRGRRGLAGDQ